MRAITWMTGAALVCAASAATAAGNAEAGRFKFSTCAGCHGIPGYTNVYPSYHVPKLGGQHAEYVQAALKEYRSGNRQHPTMAANAAALGEQDMADIAAFVAAVKPAPGTPTRTGDAEAGRQKSQTCAACHGPDGNSPSGAFPKLAGQHADYLAKALHDYRSGARKNPIMAPMGQGLSDQDILDLAAWFASQSQGLAVVE